MPWNSIQGMLRNMAEVGNDPVTTFRRRFTVAEVNAGTNLLPALPGVKYRLVDAYMVAVGGAATVATTVDILATLAGVSRKLMAAAIANLTQSAMLRAGGTGGALLADGASFTANDVGAALTIGKTGGTLAGATHIDVSVSVAIEGA